MTTATLAAPAAASIINLPPIGTMLDEHGGELAAIQRARPGSGQADYAIIVPHDDICEVRKRAWGGYGHDLAGAACMWDGHANTEALLASGHEHPIAEALREARRLSGMPDLFLPSLRELKALFANGCEAFDPTLWYWSSTQYARDDAFVQDFSDGTSVDY